MKILDNELLTSLNSDAECSSRGRVHLNFHNNFDEKVQRLFISLVQGSFVEPHYHKFPHQWEMFAVIEGVVEVVLYSVEGDKIKTLFVGEGQDNRAIEFAPFDIHSVRCVSERAVILEVKEGPFRPDVAKVMARFPKNKSSN